VQSRDCDYTVSLNISSNHETSDTAFDLVMIKVNIFNDRGTIYDWLAVYFLFILTMLSIKFLTLICDRFYESIGLLLRQLHRLPHKLWVERNNKWNC
jgi:hypothetical protein